MNFTEEELECIKIALVKYLNIWKEAFAITKDITLVEEINNIKTLINKIIERQATE